MKFSKLNWNKGPPPSQPQGSAPKHSLSNRLPDPFPSLPSEIWRKVISFAVRLEGANSTELDNPFATPYTIMNEKSPSEGPELFQDRSSLSTVCSGWHAVVEEVSAEYLIVSSGIQLKALVKKFEESKCRVGKRLGEWTLRIDFQIVGEYNVTHAVRLLQCTPNLLSYVNKNGPLSSPRKPTALEIIRSLVTHSSQSLRRVEWSGAGEAPRYQDLVELCNGLPNLTTLRLVSIFSFPYHQEGVAPQIFWPKLKTLSLAIIPISAEANPSYVPTWDTFLQCVSINSVQLPLLQHFECDIFPHLTVQFFATHGHKLRLFRTTAWTASSGLPEALSLCPNLHTFIVCQGSMTVEVPLFHPTLRNIHIIPAVDAFMIGFLQRGFDRSVMGPLDTLLKSFEKMAAPRLVELRVWNVGPYVNITGYSTWLRHWWTIWNVRGVEFCDKSGNSFQYAHSSDNAVLGYVRG